MKAGLAPGMSFTTTEGWETAEAIRTLGGTAPALMLADLAGTMERTARTWLTEFCADEEQTVGVSVCIRRPASRPRARLITATAVLREIDGRRYAFDVTAVNDNGETVAEGTHERRVILRRRFAS